MRLDKLQYQLDAIERIIAAIDDNNMSANHNFNANPLLKNTRNIDVKMETGTGKTYVYTRLMHELKQRFGFFKFIIIVPSIAIKEGVKMSIGSNEWNKHFRQEFANQSINLGIINAGDFDAKRSKRKLIPESLRSFCDSSKTEDKTINALLMNDAMLASVSMTRNDYDTTLMGSVSCPIEGLNTVKPIIIIDEPHRFKKEGKAWQNIMENIRPQLIIRFGATFPEKTIGRGKNKKTEKDYENLVYELNAVKAFNEGLVKGVNIQYPALNDPNGKKYKVKSISKGKSAFIGDVELKVGERLSVIDSAFEGSLTLEYDKSYQTQLKLSNELAVEAGLELSPQIYSNDYQSLLLSQAIEAHFEKEKENFYRINAGENPPRIKTNSLFFIDNIASFRGEGAEKGWLRVKFEELLKTKLQSEIKTAGGEYKEFLEASLSDVSATIAGYFAEDNTRKADIDIQKEVDDILRNKEKMLQFKNSNGSWNTRRFLFSKWTLREGWDNPNVFVIAKLRSSGSEISKLQEVGRGLRLPFDERGTRVSLQNSNEDFRLTYIIDYSEKEFAKKLVGEINSDGGRMAEGKITDEILSLLVKSGYAISNAKVKANLLNDDIIDEHDAIIDQEKLFALLPEESNIKIKEGKITGEGMSARPKVHLNKANFAKLKDLWDKVTRRYILCFEKVDGVDLQAAVENIFSGKDVFAKPSTQIISETLSGNDDNMEIKTSSHAVKTALEILDYGKFLKLLNKKTSLPLSLLHNGIINARKGKATPRELFNTVTLENAIKAFDKIFLEMFKQKFSYHALGYKAHTSIFTAEGEFVSELEQGVVGGKKASDIEADKKRYLYDEIVYDSEIEHDVLKVKPPKEVIVYGKLPKQSIKVPTYTGGTTSPDFVYAIQNSEDIELHLVVETKSDNQRLSDTVAVEAQKKAFEKIGGNIRWRLETDAASFERELKRLADGV
ncbi:MAG: type III restriction-modification system endonuclease [Campylobacteraceae bacterium]|jgi:type III restriction enzyme|nr:type III restriction-modification system endonuclease [Campylobacteraceae bacterium]